MVTGAEQAGENFIRQRTTAVRKIINGLIHTNMIFPQALTGEILDLGAWSGGSTEALRSFGGQVTAVEQSQTQIQKGISARRIDPDKAIVSKAEDYLALRHEPVDLIAFFGVPPAAVDVDTIFTYAQRLLNPGGAIIFTTRGEWEGNLDSLLARGARKFYPEKPYEWDQVGYIFTKAQ